MTSTTAQTTTGQTTQADEPRTTTAARTRSGNDTSQSVRGDRTTSHGVRGKLTAAVRDQGRPGVLAAFRVVVSFLFLCHGLQGFGLLGGIDGAGMAMPFGQWPGWWAGLIEVVGAVFVLAGFATRPAAVLLSGTMAYAYFTVHAPTGLLPLHNMGEPAALYSWIFLLIAVFGPGSFALGRKRRAQ
ncbi:MAG TPA: DoxX family protein [Amycolatopsis sp.]|jgi:putative oxidoreductase